MSCETCTKLKDVVRCNTKIDFGTYTPSISLNVYFEDLGTNKIRKSEATSSAGGDVVLTHGFNFRNGQTYRIWLNENDQVLTERKQWTLPDGTTTATCVLLRFMDVFDANSDRVSQATVELEV